MSWVGLGELNPVVNNSLYCLVLLQKRHIFSAERRVMMKCILECQFVAMVFSYQIEKGNKNNEKQNQVGCRRVCNSRWSRIRGLCRDG